MGEYLHKLGIVTGKKAKTLILFEKLFPEILTTEYSKPSKFINDSWSLFELNHPQATPVTRGKVFEYLVAICCAREGLMPFHIEARVAFVPNVNYDLMFYTTQYGPVCLSLKTSLRERYKQADLESIALKYVHRRAQSHLITLEETEAQGVKEKIVSGDVIGLNSCTIASKDEFDELIKKLKKLHLTGAPKVEVIQSSNIVTSEKYHEITRGKIY